jgi:hypothetical protein
MTNFYNSGTQIGGNAQVTAGAFAGGAGAQAYHQAAPAGDAAQALGALLRLIERHRSELAEPDLAKAEVEMARVELAARRPDVGRVLDALRRTGVHVGAVSAIAVALQEAAQAVRSIVGG